MRPAVAVQSPGAPVSIGARDVSASVESEVVIGEYAPGAGSVDRLDHLVSVRPSVGHLWTESCDWSASRALRAVTIWRMSFEALPSMEGMTDSEPARTAARRIRTLASSSSPAAPTMGITIYGCGPDEAALFREMAPRFGVIPTITEAAVSEANIELTFGNRCISVGHKNQITNSTLLALSRAGVAYISTRSIGCNHIDVGYAESVGIAVGNVAYSPDSVADFTLMLMLMVVRGAKSIIRRADVHDYRLNDTPGKELRDLIVGVVGTGRIGVAVMDRLRGFGCQVLAYDSRPRNSADYVPLDELLQLADVVTLHTPLNAQTHHLLNRQRIAQMKHGAFLINTGRGSLLDTEALVPALESGRLGGAALDVLEGEEGIFYADRRDNPIESEPLLRLQRMPNVLISPHTAYYTDHALRDTVENSLINCLSFESGEAAWIG